ncbi:MAG: T9SS type A sorting domain-containing protein, partial [Bacteroidia bacterium]|nr:T9SS type A sorting domain-containing protein [Bacteroidia bacterium]
LSGSGSGGTPPYTYVWYPCLSLSNCNTPNPVVTPSVNTNYVLVVIDANGCYSSDTVYVTSTVGIGTVASQNTDFLIYPNPSSGVYNILFINANEKAEITVTDIVGQQVFSSGSITAPSLPYSLNLSTQPDGIYLMQVQYKDRIFTTRLVLNK